MAGTISGKQLALRIFLALFIVGVGIGIVASFMAKDYAIKTLAQSNAKERSQFVFEVMLTKMQEGWGRADLEKIMARLNRFQPGMDVNIYRSSKVIELFGIDQRTKEAMKNNKVIQRAMEGKELFWVDKKGNRVRYLYPIRVKSECITCHYNTKEGDINGVLDISFNIEDIAIPLHQTILYFLLFLLLFLVFLYFVIYMAISKKLIDPITKFTQELERQTKKEDINLCITFKSHTIEIQRMVLVVNRLLERLRQYHAKVIEGFYQDSLTGLPNLLKLREDIQILNHPSVALFNIDRLKDLNDFYGYDVGDGLIIALVEELKQQIGSQGSLYRLGGDEIVWLKEGFIDMFALLEVLEELQNHPFIFKGSEIYLNLHCGVADGKSRLIERASQALEKAKEKNQPFVYLNTRESNEKTTDLFKHRMEWTRKLKEAFEEDRIIVYFQPILEIGLDQPHKFETLVRLKDRDGTIHPPGVFMDIALKSRLYLRLTRTVIDKAFLKMDDKPYEFSINISMMDVVDTMTRQFIIERLKDFREPQRVIIEILETESIDEFEIIQSFIREIKEIGAKVAIDDFGSGYSNYNYIVELDIDFLKIDASLIRHITTDFQSKIVVESIVWTAKRLGIKTIAEYVADEAIFAMVKKIGIDYVQGYYIGKPKAIEEA